MLGGAGRDPPAPTSLEGLQRDFYQRLNKIEKAFGEHFLLSTSQQFPLADREDVEIDMRDWKPGMTQRYYQRLTGAGEDSQNSQSSLRTIPASIRPISPLETSTLGEM